MAQQERSSLGDDTVNRRKYLAFLSGGATVALAGCTGGGGGDGGGGDGGDGGGDGADGGDGGSDGGDGEDGGSESTPIHIVTDYASEEWQTKWEDELIPNFEEETGHETNLEYIGIGTSAENRFATLIQSGDYPELHTQNFYAISDLYAQGLLAPVGETNSAIEETAGNIFVPLFQNQNGEPMGVPHGYYTLTFIYRQDIYDQLGLSVPTTWDELLSNAQTIHESNEVDTTGIAVPAAQNDYAKRFVRMLYRLAGGRLFEYGDDENVQVAFSQEPAIETLEFMEEAMQYSPDPSSVNWGSAIEYWANGRTAHLLHLNGWPIGASTGNPPIVEGSDIALPPTNGTPIEDLSLRTMFQLPEYWFVFDAAPETENAKTFLEWMYGTSLEQTISLYSQEPLRFLPAYEDVMGATAYEEIQVFQDFPSTLEINRKIQNEIVPAYEGPEEDQIPYNGAVAYSERTNVMGQMANEYLVVGKDADTAYQEARSRFEELLAEGKEAIKNN